MVLFGVVYHNCNHKEDDIGVSRWRPYRASSARTLPASTQPPALAEGLDVLGPEWVGSRDSIVRSQLRRDLCVCVCREAWHPWPKCRIGSHRGGTWSNQLLDMVSEMVRTPYVNKAPALLKALCSL